MLQNIHYFYLFLDSFLYPHLGGGSYSIAAAGKIDGKKSDHSEALSDVKSTPQRLQQCFVQFLKSGSFDDAVSDVSADKSADALLLSRSWKTIALRIFESLFSASSLKCGNADDDNKPRNNSMKAVAFLKDNLAIVTTVLQLILAKFQREAESLLSSDTEFDRKVREQIATSALYFYINNQNYHN